VSWKAKAAERTPLLRVTDIILSSIMTVISWCRAGHTIYILCTEVASYMSLMHRLWCLFHAPAARGSDSHVSMAQARLDAARSELEGVRQGVARDLLTALEAVRGSAIACAEASVAKASVSQEAARTRWKAEAADMGGQRAAASAAVEAATMRLHALEERATQVRPHIFVL
jgi:hypothetical protein